MWRDFALSAGVVILTIFCPPAGAVAGLALAGLDSYSAVSGKDWGTGRELDTTERGLRAGFALFDIIPGIGYLNDVAKSGSKVAAKKFIQTSIQKGLAQGSKNLDHFKTVLKNVKGFGDTVLKNIDTYAKQVDTLARGKLSSVADNVVSKLRHGDEVISEAAQKFSLNMGMDPQLVSGAIPASSSGRLSGLADNIQAIAKHLDGSVDEVVEAGVKAGDGVSFQILRNGEQFDKFGNLKPNAIYQTGEHNYLYQTDDFGRISRAQTDNLQLKIHDGRLRHNSMTPEKLEGDHAGHIFGDLFGGSPELDNLLSQAKDVNLKEYRRIERDWADALRVNPPKKVEVDIKINYDGISKRPISFEVKYKINGEPYSEILKNINRR